VFSLTGRPAFHGTEYKDLLEENKNGYIKFKEKHWVSVSPQGFLLRKVCIIMIIIARDLVQRILDVNPYKRISLDLVLTDKWFELMLPPDEFKELNEFNFQ